MNKFLRIFYHNEASSVLYYVSKASNVLGKGGWTNVILYLDDRAKDCIHI